MVETRQAGHPSGLPAAVTEDEAERLLATTAQAQLEGAEREDPRPREKWAGFASTVNVDLEMLPRILDYSYVINRVLGGLYMK